MGEKSISNYYCWTLAISRSNRVCTCTCSRWFFHFLWQNGWPERGTSSRSTSTRKRASSKLPLQCVKWISKPIVVTIWCRQGREIAGWHVVVQTLLDLQREDMRNFLGMWITGLTNHKRSNIVNHAKSEQHTACMGHMWADSTRVQNKPA